MDESEREALEWIVCIPWIGGKEPTRCPICRGEILTPDDIKQCRFGHKPDIVHKTCWAEYEVRNVNRTNPNYSDD
jgi:hypothetical protein